jgi:hypothetical protein
MGGSQAVKLWLARQSRQPLTDLHVPGFFSAIRIVVFARILSKENLLITGPGGLPRTAPLHSLDLLTG